MASTVVSSRGSVLPSPSAPPVKTAGPWKTWCVTPWWRAITVAARWTGKSRILPSSLTHMSREGERESEGGHADERDPSRALCRGEEVEQEAGRAGDYGRGAHRNERVGRRSASGPLTGSSDASMTTSGETTPTRCSAARKAARGPECVDLLPSHGSSIERVF